MLAEIYGGDRAAFDASKPVKILRANAGQYDGVTAIYTIGENDPTYIPGAQAVSDAALAAGMDTTYYVVPGAGHVVDALNEGLAEGFRILYPVLGLSALS